MSNISYVSSLSNNMKNLSYDGSKFNSLNVGYNDFMSNSNSINGLKKINLNNGNSIFGANLSIPKSENFTSQLDSNLKMSALAGTAMLGAVKGSVVNSAVNLQGDQGSSIGLVPMTVAIAGTLAVLGYQCQNTFDIAGKLIANPLTQAEKDEMILTEDEQVVSIYDANAGNYVLPKSTFGAMSKYIKRVGWLEASGVDTRSGYYGLTKYNVLSVEREYSLDSSSIVGTYVPHQGVNIGTSGTIEFAYTDTYGDSHQETISFNTTSDVYMDLWIMGGGYFHVTFYSLNPLTGITSSGDAFMVNNDFIYFYDWRVTNSNYVVSWTLDNWTGAESPNAINYIDMYNQLKGSVNNTRSSVVECVTNGVNTMAKIDEDARFIVFDNTGANCGDWNSIGYNYTLDFTDFTATSPIYAYVIRYVNASSYNNVINIIFCSLANFYFKDGSYKNGSESLNMSTRGSNSVTVDGHTFYQISIWSWNQRGSVDCTLALPVIEYDCDGQDIPNNPTDPISDIVKWQLLNSTATPTNIGQGSSGTVEGLDQVGTAIAIGSADTTDDIWTKCVSALPSTRFKNNALSMFTPITDSIVNQDAVAISLPTTMSETVVSTTGAKANTDDTDYTATGIGVAVGAGAIARVIGANITGVGVTDKSIDEAGSVADAVSRAMSLTYDVADTEEPSEQELVDLIGTPTVETPTGEANAMYSVYKLTQAELDSLGGWLWSSNFFTQVEKAWDNPMENIISLNKVYCTLPTGTSGTVVIGMIDSNVSCEKINTRYVSVDFGSVNINEYFGNMLDYAPYTDIQIYLPFIGIVRLDNSDVMRGLVKLTYKIDLFTGDLLATISVYRDMVEQTAYQFSGNCAVGYPYSAGSTFGSMISGFTGIASLIGAGLATSGAGLVAGLAGGVAGLASARADVQHSGNLSGGVGVMGGRTPYITITRPQVVSTDMNKVFVGNANNIVDKIGNHSGYVKVTEPQIKTLALKSEVEMISNLLERGVLL